MSPVIINRSRIGRQLTLGIAVLFITGLEARADDNLQTKAAAGLRKAVEFFRKNVATEGGYLWRYTEDLRLREGEGKATNTQVWVQPPGTPAVGLAYLAAYDSTGDTFFLDAAKETANALVRGQLRSGGWTYSIDFDPAQRKKLAYRIEGGGGERARNYTTFDDNTTQSAIRLMMGVDNALKGKDERIHEATQFALTAVLKAQYPNGAWPQGYAMFPDPAKFPVKKASFPADWPRAPVTKEYWHFYTVNDNMHADLIDTLLEAERRYNEPKYRAAVIKAADFLLLAQLPDPQPGWAQQYDFDMHPSWARKFEPPSITGGEAQGIMQTLLRMVRETGDKKYLEPIPRALEYYKKSLLPNGQLARFYELKTNKPLYFTKQYQLTHKDDDLPTHYGFKVGSKLDAIEREYERLRRLSPEELKQEAKPGRPRASDSLVGKVKAVLAAQDDRGRWVEEGRLRSQGNDQSNRIMSCQTFIQNVRVLSDYLAATK